MVYSEVYSSLSRQTSSLPPSSMPANRQPARFEAVLDLLSHLPPDRQTATLPLSPARTSRPDGTGGPAGLARGRQTANRPPACAAAASSGQRRSSCAAGDG